MVIDDAPLAALTRERMRSVMAPKAYGAWLLHEATRDLELDCFVMFSSVSSIFGNPAQGNYGAANAFLDSLAHHRRALGLPALTINWGVLGGEGYVARNERVAEFLARQGTTELSPREVMATAGIISDCRRYAGDGDPGRLGEMAAVFPRHAGESFAGAHFRIRRKPGDGRRNQRLAPQDRIGCAGGAGGIIGQAVRDAVGSVLRVKPDTLRDDQPLTEFGLDSLMGVEIENSIESAIGVALPPASLIRARTIGQIVALIAEHMGAKSVGGAVATTAASITTPEEASTDEVNLEALSDEEIEGLLGYDTASDGTSDPKDAVC